MGKIITENRIVPTWLSAVTHLEANRKRYRNLMLEIDAPTLVTDEDRAAIAVADEALRDNCDLSIQTVAGTIFPYSLYQRVGAAALSNEFFAIMKRAQEPNTWGTYAMRLLRRPGKVPGTFFSPLERVVEKLKRASGPGTGYASNYELGVHAPTDLEEDGAVFCDVPLYCPTRDGRLISNYPCLSHLSFKLTNRTHVELTAVYRSHYYVQRTLGNLVGLSYLMRFVAAETGLQVGRLTCISTDAHLDYDSWGGVNAGRAIMRRIREAAALTPGGAVGQLPQSSDACTTA